MISKDTIDILPLSHSIRSSMTGCFGVIHGESNGQEDGK